MSLVTFQGIEALLDAGVVRGAKRGHINAASLDLTLGSAILVEAAPGGSQSVVEGAP